MKNKHLFIILFFVFLLLSIVNFFLFYFLKELIFVNLFWLSSIGLLSSPPLVIFFYTIDR